jgi:hypothetical protein
VGSKAVFDKIVSLTPAACRAIGLFLRSSAAFGTLLLTIVSAPAQQPFVTMEGDPKTEAWWVIAAFHPLTTEVRGIPANRIRKNWCKATEFRKDLIPRDILFEGRGVDGMEESDLSFSLEGHFDGSANAQTALVGVYQECSGKKGRFVLILEQGTRGKPKIKFLDAVQTDRQFGALKKGDGNTIVVWACMECDATSVLKWHPKKHKFDWVPQPDEP